MKEQEGRVASLKEQLKDTQSRLDASVADIESKKSALDELQKAKESAEDELHAQKAAVDELRSQLEDLTSGLEDVQAKVRYGSLYHTFGLY